MKNGLIAGSTWQTRPGVPAVTTLSLDAWRRTFGKPEIVQRAEGDQSAEIRRLKSELRHVTRERDILKKPRRTLPRGEGEIRVHAGTFAGVPDVRDVPCAQGKPGGLRRVTEDTDGRTCEGAPAIARADQPPVADQWRRVRASRGDATIFATSASVAVGTGFTV